MAVTQTQRSFKRDSLWRAALLPVLVLGLFLLARGLGLGTGLGEARSWIAQHLYLGGLLYVAVFVLTSLALLPGLPLTLAAGAVFGSLWGVIWASAGSLAGALVPFLLARFLARESIARRLRRHELFCRIERWTDQQGSVICALLRLFPIFPYSVLNYAFGLTRVPILTYAFWTWLCMLPGTITFVVGTDAILHGIETGRLSWPHALVAGLNLALLLAQIPWARRHLRRGKNDVAKRSDIS